MLQECIVPYIMEFVQGIGKVYNFPLIIIMPVRAAHVLAAHVVHP